MKNTYALILSWLWLTLSVWGSSEYRTFKSMDGREIVAAIQRVSANEITIKRKADGRQFTVNLSTFSDKDQQFIKDWDEMNRLSQRDALEVKIRRVTGDRSKSSSLSTDSKTWMEGYEISITNETRGEVGDIEVEYIIFMFDEAVAAIEKEQGKLKRNTNKFSIKTLAVDEPLKHVTEKFQMTSSKLKEGWYYTNGGSRQSKDELAGCWVRVYKNGRILNEVAMPAAITRSEQWKSQ